MEDWGLHYGPKMTHVQTRPYVRPDLSPESRLTSSCFASINAAGAGAAVSASSAALATA